MSPQFTQQLRDWFRANARDLPWRHTRDPYAIMVSEFMLQQTQVATVIPYFKRWMERFPTVQTLAAAMNRTFSASGRASATIRGAKNLHRAAQVIGDSFPDTLAEMKKLPGMGDYTAGAISLFLPTPASPSSMPTSPASSPGSSISSNPSTPPPDAPKSGPTAAQLLPKEDAGEFNAALMELGALLCTPRPKCDECPSTPIATP